MATTAVAERRASRRAARGRRSAEPAPPAAVALAAVSCCVVLRRLGGRQVPGRHSVAGARWRCPGARSSGTRRSAGRSRTTCRCPTSGTSCYALGQPVQRGADQTPRGSSSSAPRSTPGGRRRSGSRSGRSSGSRLATVFVHSRLLERAFVPYVVASQTVPILALAPLIVFALGQDVAVGRDRRHVPDLLPGDDRHAPRPALVRPAGARADALLRRVALDDLLEAAPAGLDAVPVHRARRSPRRASIVGAIIGEDAGRHPGGSRPRDHQLQPVLHHRARRSCGRRSSCGRSSASCSSSLHLRWPSVSCCAGAGPERLT